MEYIEKKCPDCAEVFLLIDDNGNSWKAQMARRDFIISWYSHQTRHAIDTSQEILREYKENVRQSDEYPGILPGT